MKYIKAQDVLPDDILKIIQDYIDGEYLYIPRKSGEHKAWGEKSGIKNILKIRNNEIYKKYLNGSSVYELAQTYYLSEKSIRRIVNQENKLRS
ncbi:CD3324 family protein [Clostridium thermobutyricum]|uniref:CD3324 family protein n=1 Tax=Clostridium thermobutyricum TaxID=29372 RepID=UPI0018A9951B|nr:CD3324 family protein [Clostridium thermobutyricum]